MAFLYPVTQPVKVFTGLDGRPLDGGLIFFGIANQNPETSPKQMFWDAAGEIPAAQPIETIGGYISRNGTPANIFADGDFSITVKDSANRVVNTTPNSVDLQLALSIAGVGSAAAIPLADAAGHFTTDNVEAALQQIGDAGFVTLTRLAAAVQELLYQTGDTIDTVDTVARAGWVLAYGRTIGSAASGATERADADTSALYTMLWNNYANTELPIQDSAGTPTTRGASASNDFAANKRMPLPDCRNRVRSGRDVNTGSLSNRITVAGGNFDGTVMGKVGGAQNHQLTSAQMPSHTHTQNSHNHTQDAHLHTFAIGSGASIATSGSGAVGGNSTNTGSTTATNQAATATNQNTGGDGAHPNVQPTIIFTVIIKL